MGEEMIDWFQFQTTSVIFINPFCATCNPFGKFSRFLPLAIHPSHHQRKMLPSSDIWIWWMFISNFSTFQLLLNSPVFRCVSCIEWVKIVGVADKQIKIGRHFWPSGFSFGHFVGYPKLKFLTAYFRFILVILLSMYKKRINEIWSLFKLKLKMLTLVQNYQMKHFNCVT